MILLAAVSLRSWFVVSAGLLVLVVLAAGVWRTDALAAEPIPDLVDSGRTVRVEMRLDGAGRLWEAAGSRPAWWRGSGKLLSVTSGDERWSAASPVEVQVSGERAASWEALPVGAVVEVAARLVAADPGERAVAVVKVRGDHRIAEEPDLVAVGVEAIRSGLRQACARLPADARALLPGLVVGDTSGMPEGLAEDMRTTGLAHLTAVSGANLTLLLVVLRAGAVWVGVRGRWIGVVLGVGVAGFVVVCLAEPSVVRAATMGVVGLVALGRANPARNGTRQIATAILLVLTVDPWMARSVAFTLSVAATLGIVWRARRWAELLAGWLPRWIAEACSVTVAAQLATLPVLVAIAGQVSVVGPLTNLAAAPLVAPATVLGLAAALVSPAMPGLAVVLVWPAGICASGIALIGRTASSVPGATLSWPISVGGVVGAAGVALVGFLLLARLVVRPGVVLALTALLVVAALRGPVYPGWPLRDWVVAVCDVGQGDAVVLNAGGGIAVVVDTGPEPALLAQCLDRLAVRAVPMVVLTHLHADHSGGLAAVAGLGMQELVTSRVRSPKSGEARVADVDARRILAGNGSAWRIGAVHLRVLLAPELVTTPGSGEGESTAENDASLLIRAEVGGVSMLIAGDVEMAGQRRRLALGKALAVDVILVPHHGSGRQWPAFVRATAPDLAVISVGEGNDYGHPAAAALSLVAATGATVVRTDQVGTVAVRRDPTGLVMATVR